MCEGHGLSRRRFLALAPGAVAVGAILTGCGEKVGALPVRWGEETCVQCGRVIADPHFAAEIREGTGRTVWKFDDPGCAIRFLDRQPWADDPRVEFWAGNIDHPAWLDGRLAWFVAGQTTPAGYGYGATPHSRDGAIGFTDFHKAISALPG